ncbi:MAG TPA: ATP-binding protein, partial [Gallionella sp.]|nr:ATP-binding protein [Gallionella sp.]
AEIGTHDLALALERELVGQIQSEEMALLSVQDELYRQRARGRVDAAALNAYMERVHSRLPEIDAIRIADERGMLVYGTDVRSADKISLSDRPHFIKLREEANAGLVISRPQISRVNNKAVIVLARRLEHQDGSFGGMVFATVPLANLTSIFSALNVGERGVVAMRDDELALVASFPLHAMAIDGKSAAAELQLRLQAGQAFGTYRTQDDKIERTVSFRKVGDYPFFVIVGRASGDYLADTNQTVKVILGLLVLFFLVTLLLANMAYRSWLRQLRLNQSLLESETRLDELFENMSSGVAVYRVSADGETFSFSGLNRAAEKFDNSLREDLLGKNVVDVFPGIVELGLLEVFKRVWKTGIPERYPLSFYHDGRISGWRDNFVYKLPSGEIVAIYDDVTERMQAQLALEELNRDFVSLLENTSDFIYFKDKDSRIRFCSQSMALITGHRNWHELAGKHDQEIFPPETAKLYSEEELPIFRDGVPLLNKTDPYFDAQGNRRWVNANKWPVFDSDGKTVIGLFGISRDITERQKIEDALQRSNADLERFAYSVSHDMRQPLRAVSGHLQLLQRSLKDKLDEDERMNLDFALEGARRMDSMIVSLLDYSRVGRKTESKQWIESRASVDEALHFLAPLIAESGADVSLNGEWPKVFASRDEMTRLFQNLVGNAIKFRESGQSPVVEVDSSLHDDSWRVSVRDHGVGIDPQQIDRLFQFFSRLQSRVRFDGTGMGLALCRRIVEHHNGRIWVESEGVGCGSVFIFELPLKTMEASAA